MAKDWYYQVMGQKFGPVTYGEIVRLARQGSVQPETLLRKGVAGNWMPADQVKGVFGSVPTAPRPAAEGAAGTQAQAGGPVAAKGTASATQASTTESKKGARPATGAIGPEGAAAEAAEAAIEVESSVRPCPECSKSISKKVPRCPHCGATVEHEGESATERQARVLTQRARAIARYWPVMVGVWVVGLAAAAGIYYYVNRPVVLTYEGKTVEEWQEQLRSSDRDLKVEAMVALGYLAVQAPRLVPDIVQLALTDKDPRNRIDALAIVSRTAAEASAALNETGTLTEERFHNVIAAIREQVPAVRKETLAATAKQKALAQRIAAYGQDEKKTNPPEELLAEQKQVSEYVTALQRFPLNDWAQHDPTRVKKTKKKPEKKLAKAAEKKEPAKKEEKKAETKDEPKEKPATQPEKKDEPKQEKPQEKKDDKPAPGDQPG